MLEEINKIYDGAVACGFHILDMDNNSIEMDLVGTNKINAHLSVYKREPDKYECLGDISFGEGKRLRSEMIHIDKEVSSEREVNILINDIRTTVKTINSLINSQQELF